MRTRRSREEWSALLDELAESGEPLDSFCRRHSIRRSTLYWWKWRLGSSRRRSAPRAAIRLLPVAVSSSTDAPPRAPNAIVIHIADVQVRVEIGTDVEYVRALVDALRLRC
jgi:hypothetical protein